MIKLLKRLLGIEREPFFKVGQEWIYEWGFQTERGFVTEVDPVRETALIQNEDGRFRLVRKDDYSMKKALLLKPVKNSEGEFVS